MVLFPAPPRADTIREDFHDPGERHAGRSESELRCRRCGPIVEKLLFEVFDLEERLGIARMVAAAAGAKVECEQQRADKLREELDQEIAEGQEALVRSQGQLLEAMQKHEAEVKLVRDELAAAQSTVHELNATVQQLRHAGAAVQVAHEETEQLHSELDTLRSELKLRPMPEDCSRLRTELQTVRAELKARPPREECDQLRSELQDLRLELKFRPTLQEVAKMQAKLQQQSASLKHFCNIESHLNQLAAELQASQAREQEAQATMAKMAEHLASTRSQAIDEGFDELVAADWKAAISTRQEASKWMRELAASQKRELRLKEEIRNLRAELRLLVNSTWRGLTGEEGASLSTFSSPHASPLLQTKAASPTASTASPTGSVAETLVAIHVEQRQVLSPSHSPSPIALAAWNPAPLRSAASPRQGASSPPVPATSPAEARRQSCGHSMYDNRAMTTSAPASHAVTSRRGPALGIMPTPGLAPAPLGLAATPRQGASRIGSSPLPVTRLAEARRQSCGHSMCAMTAAASHTETHLN